MTDDYINALDDFKKELKNDIHSLWDEKQLLAIVMKLKRNREFKTRK